MVGAPAVRTRLRTVGGDMAGLFAVDTFLLLLSCAVLGQVTLLIAVAAHKVGAILLGMALLMA